MQPFYGVLPHADHATRRTLRWWARYCSTLRPYFSCGGRRECESLSRCVCRADVRRTSYLLAFTPGAGTSPQWLSRRDIRQGPEHRPEPTKAGNPSPPNDLDHRLYESGRSGPSLWTGVMVRCYQWLAASNSPASGGVAVLVRFSWSALSQLLRPRAPAITIWQVYRSRLPKPPPRGRGSIACQTCQSIAHYGPTLPGSSASTGRTLPCGNGWRGESRFHEPVAHLAIGNGRDRLVPSQISVPQKWV